MSIEASARKSLLRNSPALILLIVAIADIQRWADPDLWGHVAFGRAMLAMGHLTFHDPYSYSAPGHLWLNHEWLSELLMGAIYNFGGVIGLKLMKFTCCAALIVAITISLAEVDSPPRLQVWLLLVASISIAPQIQFRPQLFSFAAWAVLLAILTKFTYRGRAPLLAVVPLLCLWANLHGSFIIGLAVLGIFTAMRMTTDLLGGRGPRVGMKLLAILVASTLITIVTPYGFGTWHAVAHAMVNPHTRAVINDWQSLPQWMLAMWRENHIGVIPGSLAIAMFLTLAVSLILNPRAGDSALVAIAVLMIAAAIIAMRNLPFAVIATAIALARHSSPLARTIQTYPTSRFAQPIVGMVAIGILVGSGLLSTALRAGSPKPNGAIRFILTHRLRGNVLSSFDWGEYLIWQIAPASKVFIDGRYDTVYPPSCDRRLSGVSFRPTRRAAGFTKVSS